MDIGRRRRLRCSSSAPLPTTNDSYKYVYMNTGGRPPCRRPNTCPVHLSVEFYGFCAATPQHFPSSAARCAGLHYVGTIYILYIYLHNEYEKCAHGRENTNRITTQTNAVRTRHKCVSPLAWARSKRANGHCAPATYSYRAYRDRRVRILRPSVRTLCKQEMWCRCWCCCCNNTQSIIFHSFSA